MANMSYCRFQNTKDDLRDCWEHFHETDDLSEAEQKARKRIIWLAKDIADNYGDELEE